LVVNLEYWLAALKVLLLVWPTVSRWADPKEPWWVANSVEHSAGSSGYETVELRVVQQAVLMDAHLVGSSDDHLAEKLAHLKAVSSAAPTGAL
jgi:hypothetical protein